MLKKTAATIRARLPERKTRFNSNQYEGERSLTAISQNFFVVGFEIMPFSQNAAAEKESLAGAQPEMIPGLDDARARPRERQTRQRANGPCRRWSALHPSKALRVTNRLSHLPSCVQSE
jgi:hypothetical protein